MNERELLPRRACAQLRPCARVTRTRLALPLALTAVALGACGPTDARDFGERLFSEPRLSTSELNAYSCSTCHAVTSDGRAADEEDRGAVRFSGHTLFDSAFRPSYWGGAEPLLLDAVNVCFTGFMRGAEPLSPESPESKALYEYLVSISPDREAQALPFTVVRQVEDLPRGDVGDGERLYEAACASCHGQAGTGADRSPENTPILPDVTRGYAEDFPGSPPSLVVVEKVRHGRFFSVSGTMPPFGLEALSDEELGDLLAFLGL